MELVANSTPVRLFLDYLDHLGISPRALKVGHIDPRLRKSTAPVWVSARLIVELLEATTLHTGRDDIGLDFVAWVNLRGFGELSLVWEQCSSLAERFAIDRRYIHLENNAVYFEIAEDGDSVALVHSVVPPLRPRAQQFLDGLVAVTVRTTRLMLGKSWKPVRVELAGPRRSTWPAYRNFFACPLRCDAQRHAVVFRRADVERPLAQGNPDMVAYLKKQLAVRDRSLSIALEDQVAQLVASNLAGRVPTLAGIAALLAMSPRTLQRQLAARGTDFRAVLQAVRVQIATAILDAPRPPRLAKLAYDLGFSESSAACRFLNGKVTTI